MTQNIDKIIYINLERRTDRKEQIEHELSQMNLMDKTIHFSAIDTPGRGIVGCTYSHLACLKLAKELGLKNVLILEDDFMFVVDKETLEKNLSDFFNANIPYDVCMISYLLQHTESTEYPCIQKVIDAQTASGYIVNQCFYDNLIELYEDAAPKLDETMEHWLYANDQVWKQLQPISRWYCIERCGKQRAGYSDNSEKYTDYNG